MSLVNKLQTELVHSPGPEEAYNTVPPFERRRKTGYVQIGQVHAAQLQLPYLAPMSFTRWVIRVAFSSDAKADEDKGHWLERDEGKRNGLFKCLRMLRDGSQLSSFTAYSSIHYLTQ